VNPGGPSRGRRPWPAAGSRAGGLGRGSRLCMHGSLLARRRLLAPLTEIHGWRRWECRTRSRSCLDHADGASTRADADERPAPTTIQCRAADRGRSYRRAHSRLVHQPPSGSGTSRGTFGPAGSRYGHGQSARGVQVAGRGAVPSVGLVSRIPTCKSGQERRGHDPAAAPLRHDARPASRPSVRAVGPPSQGRGPSRASSPISHLRPTRSSARIRFTDHPCSTWRACR